MFRDAGTIRDKDGDALIIDRVVERSELEAVVRPVVEQTIGYCHEAVALATKEAGITLADVDRVILAGGSTHIPLVRELVTQELCGPGGARCAEPTYDKVDTIVTLGAAIRAAASGGLAIYDRERTMRVSFRGTGATSATTTRAAGTVESLTGAVDLADGRIHLATSEYDDEAELGSGGTFAFTRIPIQPNAESQMAYEVFDGAGNLVLSAGRSVTHSPDLGPDGKASNSAKLAKAFVLEVNRGGKSYLKELIPALASLPANADFTFSHPGSTETLLFPLYQRKRKIQVISVPVPSMTPRGTPIKFNVRIDGLAMITVRGSIGDTTFDARVEQPPERDIPKEGELGQLEDQFRDAIQYLKAGDRAVTEARWDQLKAGLDAAVARGDELQASHDIEELEVMVGELPNAEALLDPPKEEFDQLVDDCRELNVYVCTVAADAKVPHDEQETARSIDAQCEHGERAFRNRDQRAYAEAIQMLERIRDYLLGIYRKVERGNDRRTDAERLAGRARNVGEFAKTVMRLAEAAGRADFQQEIAIIQRRLDEVEREAARPASGADRVIDQSAARLMQINKVLTAPVSGQIDKLAEEV
jgi:molecular chaperone DnaK